MDQTKWQQLIRDELVDKLEAGEGLTVAERAMAALILANARFEDRPSESDAEVTDTPRTQASVTSSPYTPSFWAHVAVELRSMHAQLGVVGPPPPEVSDFWHQAMWRLRQQMNALLCQIDVPSEFIDAETRLQVVLGFLFWVANDIDRWQGALRKLESYDTALHDLANDMGYQGSLIRERAKHYGYRELGGESTPSPVVLSPTPSEREDMLLRRLHEHTEIMRDWAESLRIAPDPVEVGKVVDRMHRHIAEDRRWMVEHGYEASS